MYKWGSENLVAESFSIWVRYEEPRSPYCVMSYCWWGCREKFEVEHSWEWKDLIYCLGRMSRHFASPVFGKKTDLYFVRARERGIKQGRWKRTRVCFGRRAAVPRNSRVRVSLKLLRNTPQFAVYCSAVSMCSIWDSILPRRIFAELIFSSLILSNPIMIPSQTVWFSLATFFLAGFLLENWPNGCSQLLLEPAFHAAGKYFPACVFSCGILLWKAICVQLLCQIVSAYLTTDGPLLIGLSKVGGCRKPIVFGQAVFHHTPTPSPAP